MDSICLHSGRTVQIRALRPDDGERLRAAHARLSPTTQYRRYHAIRRALSDKDARYLVDVDGRDHVALVATPVDDPEWIVAVTRFAREESDPTAAEFAIVIADEYQRDGLGSALFARLIETARAVGVERFTGTILADNPAARGLVNRSVEIPPTWHRLGTIDEVELTLTPVAALAA